MKNGLLKEIKEELPEKKRQLRVLKEEEHKAQIALLALRKRRRHMEKMVALDEDYIKTVESPKNR